MMASSGWGQTREGRIRLSLTEDEYTRALLCLRTCVQVPSLLMRQGLLRDLLGDTPRLAEKLAGGGLG